MATRGPGSPHGRARTLSRVRLCRYERIFQVATWGHCALLLAFLLREAVPAAIGAAVKLLKVAAGLRPTSRELHVLDEQIPFMDALEGGTMRVRALRTWRHAWHACIVGHCGHRDNAAVWGNS